MAVWSVQALLSQPLALAKLGGFLRDVFKQKDPRAKAMVVVGPQDARHNCLVVATVDQPSSRSLQVCPSESVVQCATCLTGAATFAGAFYLLSCRRCRIS